jgi:hypothetical protein
MSQEEQSAQTPARSLALNAPARTTLTLDTVAVVLALAVAVLVHFHVIRGIPW